MSTPPLDRFGALARRLAVTASRRGLLARLTTGLAATIALADRDGVVAKSCPPCRKKKHGRCKKQGRPLTCLHRRDFVRSERCSRCRRR